MSTINRLKGRAVVLHVTRDRIRIANVLFGTAPDLGDFRTVPLENGVVEDGVILRPDDLRKTLAEVLKSDAYQGARRAVLVLCSTQVVSEVAKVQRSALKRLDRLLTANMDMYFPIRVDDYKLTYEVIGPNTEDPEQIDVQLWAVPVDMLRSYYALANACGLYVEAVDYGGHAMAAVAGASFALPKAQTEVRKKGGEHLPKKIAVPAAPSALPEETEPDEENTRLYLNMEQEQMMLTFVHGRQVKMQRVLARSSSDYVEDMDDVLMAVEYYNAFYPGLSREIQVFTTGDLAGDAALWEAVSRSMNVEVQVFTNAAGPRWALSEGACSTTLDFGDTSLNRVRQAQQQLGQAWQYVLVAAGGIALIFALLLTFGSSGIWDSELNSRAGQLSTLILRNQENQRAAEELKNQIQVYQSQYESYSTDWDTIFGRSEDGGTVPDPVLQTYNDNLARALEEIESTLPENASVTRIGITDQGLILELRCEDKGTAGYTIMALRAMDYMNLPGDGITNLYSAGEEREALWREITNMLSDDSPGLMDRIRDALGLVLSEGGAVYEGDALPYQQGILEQPPQEGSDRFEGSTLNDAQWDTLRNSFTSQGAQRAKDNLINILLPSVWPDYRYRTFGHTSSAYSTSITGWVDVRPSVPDDISKERLDQWESASANAEWTDATPAAIRFDPHYMYLWKADYWIRWALGTPANGGRLNLSEGDYPTISDAYSWDISNWQDWADSHGLTFVNPQWREYPLEELTTNQSQFFHLEGTTLLNDVDLVFADLTAQEQEDVMIEYVRQGSLQGFNYSLDDLLNGQIALTWNIAHIPTASERYNALKAMLTGNPHARERLFGLIATDMLENPDSEMFTSLRYDILRYAKDYANTQLDQVRVNRERLTSAILASSRAVSAAVELIRQDGELSDQYTYYLATELGLYESMYFAGTDGDPFSYQYEPVAGTLDVERLIEDLMNRRLDGQRRQLAETRSLTLDVNPTDAQLQAALARFIEASADPYGRDVVMDKMASALRSYIERTIQRYNHDAVFDAQVQRIIARLEIEDPEFFDYISRESVEAIVYQYMNEVKQSDEMDEEDEKNIEAALLQRKAAVKAYLEEVEEARRQAEEEAARRAEEETTQQVGEDVPPEPDYGVYFTAALNYREALRELELERKGLNYDEKVAPLEVEG